jgi:hypothetical protein
MTRTEIYERAKIRRTQMYVERMAKLANGESDDEYDITR